jgi:HSP20 family protein
LDDELERTFTMALSFDPFSQLDRFASSVFSAPTTRVMPVDLFRDGDQYVLNADMPGVDPGSVDVDVDGQLLTIRAQRTAARREGAKWLVQERPEGSYMRQFALGEGIDVEHISADYANGVLSVIIPMSERAKPRKIAVGNSTPGQASIRA